MLDFLGFWWSKGPNENVHIFHLVKWRGVKLEIKIQWERLIHLREKKKEREISVIFAYSLENVFQSATPNLFTIGFDCRFYAHDALNCPVISGKKDLQRKISVSHYLLYILGF